MTWVYDQCVEIGKLFLGKPVEFAVSAAPAKNKRKADDAIELVNLCAFVVITRQYIVKKLSFECTRIHEYTNTQIQ